MWKTSNILGRLRTAFDLRRQAPYNKLNETLFNRRTAQTCAAHLLPYLKPTHRILDIGCGPGSITIGLAELVTDGEAIGIDINAGRPLIVQRR